MFTIDASITAYESGFLHHTLSSIKSCIESVSYPDTTWITLVTYDSTINFFTIPVGENAEMSINIVGDINNPFVPLPFSKLMLNVTDDHERLSALIDKIYNYYN